MHTSKITPLLAALLVIGGIIALLEYNRPIRAVPRGTDIPLAVFGGGDTNREQADRQAIIQSKLNRHPRAKELQNPQAFINTDTISLGELVGKKVVLVDFWTYSCINCQRTLPYLNAWWEKYKDKGLVIVGVHTPEFEFEKKLDNVRLAVEKFGVRYPVALDNDYATWSAYQNQYWPHKYLIDIDGFIVYDHIGEGGYEETERKIQKLLEERMVVLGEQGEIQKTVSQPANVPNPDFGKIRSPETYFGSARNQYLGNGEKLTPGVQTFTRPTIIAPNALYLEGEWSIEPEFSRALSPGAKIIFRYRAKDVYVVAGADEPVRLTILRDGAPPARSAGKDSGDNGVLVKEERLYRLVEDPDGYGEHTIEIIIEKPGLRAFAFTFG